MSGARVNQIRANLKVLAVRVFSSSFGIAEGDHVVEGENLHQNFIFDIKKFIRQTEPRTELRMDRRILL